MSSMYNVFLLKDDNTVARTVKSPVMEKTSNVDQIQFITSKTYNGLDMAEFDLVLTYKLPISKAVKIVPMTLVDDNYKDTYLLYTLPVIAKEISSEVGDVSLAFTQMKVSLDPDTGEQVKYVRSYKEAFLPIIAVPNYLNLTDDGLSDLASLYLANKAEIEALQELANAIYAEKADDIVIDSATKKVQLTASGALIGEGITLEDLNNQLVEEGSLTAGNIKIVQI